MSQSPTNLKMQQPNNTSETSSTGETEPTPETQALEKHEGGGSELPPQEGLSYDPEQYKEDLILDRREKAYQLRVVQRKSFREIAEELKVSVYTAHTDVKWVVDKRVTALVEIDKKLVVRHDEIYEALLDKWLPFATRDEVALRDPENPTGELQLVEVTTEVHLQATDRILKVLTEQAKLHGLGQAGKIPGDPKDIGKAVGDHVLQEMQKLARKGRTVKAEIIDQPELKDASQDT